MIEQTIDPGTAVFDARGAWIGIVSLKNTPGARLIVQAGRWFPKEISLPVSAIAAIEDGAIHLGLSKGELKATVAAP